MEVYETIINFIQKHGVDKVKKEAKETAPVAEVIDQVDAPVEAAAAAVSVKSSDSDSEKETKIG